MLMLITLRKIIPMSNSEDVFSLVEFCQCDLDRSFVCRAVFCHWNIQSSWFAVT